MGKLSSITEYYKNRIIPVMLCYDNNYIIPSAVAIHSMLRNSNKSYFYKIYVLHTDIKIKNIKKLKEEIKKFNNASIEFINMNNKFDDLFSTTKAKAHYSKEMYYKLIAGSIFKEYDKIIITDVDVVFLGDISPSYINFNVNDDFYLAGIGNLQKIDFFLKNYKRDFNKKEQDIIKNGVGAGYLVLNLKKIRKDNLEQKFLKFIKQNVKRLLQPEQDTFNLCVDGKIKFLPLKYMTCSYFYNLYNFEELNKEKNFSIKEQVEAYINPVQLHYATSRKPWLQKNTVKSEIWFNYLLKTNFKRDYYIKKLKQNIFRVK